MHELAGHALGVVAIGLPTLGWPTTAPTATLVGCVVNPHLDATCGATPADAPVGVVAVIAALSLLLLARRAGPTLTRFA